MRNLRVRADEVQPNDAISGRVVSGRRICKPPGQELWPNAKATHVKITFYDSEVTSMTTTRDTEIEVTRP